MTNAPKDLAQYRERLAVEVHGWEDAGKYWHIPTGKRHKNTYKRNFQPDNTLHQAMALLVKLETQGWRWAIDRQTGSSDVKLLNPETEQWTRSLGSWPLPAAIVTAVVKAKGWVE